MFSKFMLECVSVAHSFSWLNTIPPQGFATLHVLIRLVIHIWVVSALGYLVNTEVMKTLCKVEVASHKSPYIMIPFT